MGLPPIGLPPKLPGDAAARRCCRPAVLPPDGRGAAGGARPGKCQTPGLPSSCDAEFDAPDRREGPAMSRALIVHGGWDGHYPYESSKIFHDFLVSQGFEVELADTLEVYAGLPPVDLVVQCWTGGNLTDEQEAGLVTHVRSGGGFAGWHGGIVAFGYENPQYQYLVGGRFVFHPGGFVDYTVDIAGDHPITAGIASYPVHTEQYYCHVDPALTVLATTTFAGVGEAPETAGTVMPVVWARQFGAGRVFVNTLGHSPDDLLVPQTRAITERGLRWAAGG
jgi:type 1 glutamine amidotransferase